MSFGMEYGGGVGGFGGGTGGFSNYMIPGDMDMGAAGGFLDTDKSAEKNRNRDNHTLNSVSIKQMLTADADDTEIFRVDGAQLYQVKLIGFIESMATHSTSQVYMINDGSGTIECKTFIDKTEGSSGPSEGEFRENMQVKVFGQLRQYEGRRHVLIHKIMPLTDFNELTHHLLEVTLTHLQNTVGPIPGSAAAMATPYRAGVASMSLTPSGAPSGVYPAANLNSLMQRGGADNFNDVLCEVIRNMGSHDGAGAHIQDIMMGLQQRKISKSMVEVKKALTTLLEQGAMYTGADDDRYCVI